MNSIAILCLRSFQTGGAELANLPVRLPTLTVAALRSAKNESEQHVVLQGKNLPARKVSAVQQVH